ncbi:MAG: response regulator transcription factor [Bacteroidales bacterium]|nr:response regulator transcription factor [Bacteroidales bacterium]
MLILIVEDEKELALSIRDYLKGIQDITCDLAPNFSKAVELTELYSYDCLIVDLGLPDGDGLEIIKKVKTEDAQTGIIIISARDTLDDRLKGLNIGADDYLTKPFHLSELQARIASVLRRIRFDGKSILKEGVLEVDTVQRKIKVNGKEPDLTKSEFNILEYLITNKNKVVTKASIAEHILGEYSDMYSSYDFVYTHIKNLRKKLVELGCPDYIKTVYGTGYIFETA